MSVHLFPDKNEIVSRTEKETLLGQQAKVFWFVGLSGSGKTTIAKQVEKLFFEAGHYTVLLDGDSLRTGLGNNLTFTEADRTENLRRAAEVAKLFVQNGTIVLACFISPTIADRTQIQQIIEKDYVEIFVDTALETCEARDVKGLYKKARAGEIPNFTGISAPFEKPINADYIIDTANSTISETAEKLFSSLLDSINA